MPTDAKLRGLVKSVESSKVSEHDLENLVLLGEALREAFAVDAPLSKIYDALAERMQKKRVADASEEPDPRLHPNLLALARAAGALLDDGQYTAPPAVQDREQRRIVELMDRAFYESRLFYFARIIVTVSRGLLGLVESVVI